MPEEINRILTDCISDLLFCTEKAESKTCAAKVSAREESFLVGI